MKDCSGNGFCDFGRCVCYNGFTGDDCSVAHFIDFVGEKLHNLEVSID